MSCSFDISTGLSKAAGIFSIAIIRRGAWTASWQETVRATSVSDHPEEQTSRPGEEIFDDRAILSLQDARINYEFQATYLSKQSKPS